MHASERQGEGRSLKQVATVACADQFALHPSSVPTAIFPLLFGLSWKQMGYQVLSVQSMQLEHLRVVEIAIFRINSPAANNCSFSGNKPFVGLESIPPIPRSMVQFILNHNVILYFSKRNASYLQNT